MDQDKKVINLLLCVDGGYMEYIGNETSSTVFQELSSTTDTEYKPFVSRYYKT